MRRLALLATASTWRFLQWWVAELASVVQSVLGPIAPTWNRPVTVYVEDGRLRVYDGAPHLQEPVVDLQTARMGTEIPGRIADDLATAFVRGRRARVVIASQKAFTRSLRLPLAALPYLKTAIALRLPKLMPLDLSSLLTDYEQLTADDDGCRIELAAVKRVDLSSLIPLLQAGGLRIESLHLADAPDARRRFRFSGLDLGGRESGLRRIDRLLLIAAASLAFLCVTVTVVQEFRVQRALKIAQQQVRPSSDAALGRRQQLVGKLEPLSALTALEAAPTVGALLADLSTTVPHDTWITTLELKDRRLRIVGISPDSAALVKRLASSAYLNEVELKSAMSVGIGTGKDRFEIIADARPRTP